MGAVDGNSESRRTGESAGYQPYHARRINVESIFQPYCRQRGGTDYQQGNDYECFPFAPERVEETGTCLYADGEYKYPN